MANPDWVRIYNLLERIATALEVQSAAHLSDAVMERMIAVQERGVALAEQHNQLHFQQGLPLPESNQ